MDKILIFNFIFLAVLPGWNIGGSINKRSVIFHSDVVATLCYAFTIRWFVNETYSETLLLVICACSTA
jgi:hypothetical protein